MVAVTAVAAALLSACGSSDASDSGAGGSGIEDVYAQIDGLSLEQRGTKLLELAKAEGGQINFYAGTKPEDTDPIIEAFEKKYGIKVSNYRAGGEVIAQKVLQEVQAKHDGADLYVADASQGSVLANLKALAPLKTPLSERLVPGSATDYTMALYVIAPVISWNTNLVKDPPKDIEDALTRFRGKFMIEQEDGPWFEALVKEYFVKQKGMTEDAAIKYFEDSMKGAFVVKGHTLETTLLTSGQAEVCLGCYYHAISSGKAEGAPIEAEPVVQPVPYTFISAGIPVTAKRPATALLFLDFLLTDGQKMFVEQNRNPANVDYEGNFKLEEYKNFPYALSNDKEELAKWSRIYENVLAKAGGKVIEK
ncbi:ABC transporter substrate-binding protein [Streptosporangium sp. NPDC001559]|uniref:ABC transporter substrate-binding protein n=1 Tax=Streptosporangium sp. NPDC001559 TaxID=3366187 RepID=UPI0036EE6848